MGGYGERKLPTTTSSASDPDDQPNSAAWVMLRPPLTTATSPLISLRRPTMIPPKREKLCPCPSQVKVLAVAFGTLTGIVSTDMGGLEMNA
jgi:hypothetical protein